jgi:hypothetical protein
MEENEDLDLLYSEYLEYVSNEWDFGEFDGVYNSNLTLIVNRNDSGVSYRAFTFDEFVENVVRRGNTKYRGN